MGRRVQGCKAIDHAEVSEPEREMKEALQNGWAGAACGCHGARAVYGPARAGKVGHIRIRLVVRGADWLLF